MKRYRKCTMFTLPWTNEKSQAIYEFTESTHKETLKVHHVEMGKPLAIIQNKYQSTVHKYYYNQKHVCAL